jgi:glutathione S-transferase
VCSAGKDNLSIERMKVASELWNAGIKAELIPKETPKYLDQANYCEKHLIPYMVVLGVDEVQRGVVKIKETVNRDDKGQEFPRAQMVAELKKRLSPSSDSSSTSTSSRSSIPQSEDQKGEFVLYTYPNNPRAFKALIAANYNQIKIKAAPFTFGETNKSAAFLKKFPLGKVPALETPDGRYIAESNAISFCIASSKKDTILLGKTPQELTEIQMFINTADNEILAPAAAWVYPILGLLEYSKAATEKAKEDLTRTLKALDTLLAGKTYLVGTGPTLADIHIVLALLHPYCLVFDEEYRKPFSNVTRYFLTMVNQPEFKQVIGEITLPKNMAVYDPNNLPPKFK